MNANYLTIPEELFMLGIENAEGNLSKMQSNAFQLTLASSVLMELSLRGKIDTDTEHVIISNTDPTDNEVLNLALNNIQLDGEPRNINYWVNKLGAHHEAFIYSLLNALIRKEILKIEQQKVLWIFKTLKYPLIDKEEVKDVKARIRELIFSEDIPDLHDMVVVSLLYYGGMLHYIFSQDEIDKSRVRIELIAKMDLIGQNVGDRLKKELDLALAMASGASMIH